MYRCNIDWLKVASLSGDVRSYTAHLKSSKQHVQHPANLPRSVSVREMAASKGLAIVLDLAASPASSTAAHAAAIGAASVPVILYNLRKAQHVARAEAIFSPYGPISKTKQATPVSATLSVLGMVHCSLTQAYLLAAAC